MKGALGGHEEPAAYEEEGIARMKDVDPQNHPMTVAPCQIDVEQPQRTCEPEDTCGHEQVANERCIETGKVGVLQDEKMLTER